MRIAVPAICIIIILTLAGCALNPGNVYVAVYWLHNDVANMPTGLAHSIVGLPALGTIVPGAYYWVIPGAVTFDTTYPGPVTWPATFNLQAKIACMGVEDNYYDIICDATGAATCNEVPY